MGPWDRRAGLRCFDRGPHTEHMDYGRDDDFAINERSRLFTSGYSTLPRSGVATGVVYGDDRDLIVIKPIHNGIPKTLDSRDTKTSKLDRMNSWQARDAFEHDGNFVE